MTISEVSKKYDLTSDTLRYYERIGLLVNIPRNSNGIRNYDENSCKRIEFIKCMRNAGVEIEILIEYMNLFEKNKKIEEENRSLLLEMKYKIENILKDNQKGPKHGSGVGLINVHTRIQLMFGNKYGLIVESEPDEGTTVTIHLPAVPYTKENCEVLETPGKPVRKEGES